MDPKLAASLSHFAFRFLKEQISNNKDKSKPLICSPLSVEMVLALTALGSTGDTHAELLKTMNLPDDETLRSLFGYLTSTLKHVNGVTLNIANRLYVKKAGTLKPDIKKDAEEVFDSGLEQLDFTQSIDAANIMNAWVANQTNNMIPSIVSPSWLDEDTSLVMINAIYFKGLWKSPFLKGSTSDRTFHVDTTTDIKVPMMSKSRALFRYKHSPELKAKILQMYYQDGEACMIFVLPDEIEGLSELMQQLANGHDLAAELEDLETSLVDVMIPKFKVQAEINLKKLLPKVPYVTMQRCVNESEPFFREQLSSDKICTGFKRGPWGTPESLICPGDHGSGLAFYSGTGHSAIPYLRGVASTPFPYPVGNTVSGCSMLRFTAYTHVASQRTFLERHVPGLEEKCGEYYEAANFECNCFCNKNKS